MGRKIFLLFFIISITSFSKEPKILNLCVNNRNWYPFTYVEDNLPKGLHIDIIKKTFENLGYKINIKVYPYNRCLLYLKEGRMDGMISITYDENLPYIEYPPDAADTGESKWRIMQIDYMVISYKDNKYKFRNNIKTLPVPIRITRGYPLKKIFQDNDLKVEIGKSDKHNFQKLIRDKKGTVITASLIAEVTNYNDEISGKFHISSTPLASQSFFLVFSKTTDISLQEKMKIWDEIAFWRDDYVFMLGIYSQY